MEMMLKIEEVARRLRISKSMAYALVARGELACYEIGSCKRSAEADLRAYLDTKRREGPKLPTRRGRHF